MAHSSTILSQMLKFFSRHEFQKLVLKHQAEYHARGVTSWSHFVAMLYGQLAGQDALRGAYVGAKRPAVSVESGHPNRRKAAT